MIILSNKFWIDLFLHRQPKHHCTYMKHKIVTKSTFQFFCPEKKIFSFVQLSFGLHILSVLFFSAFFLGIWKIVIGHIFNFFYTIITTAAMRPTLRLSLVRPFESGSRKVKVRIRFNRILHPERRRIMIDWSDCCHRFSLLTNPPSINENIWQKFLKKKTFSWIK